MNFKKNNKSLRIDIKSENSLKNNPPIKLESFEKLPKKLKDGLYKINWKVPTKIQSLCLPYSLNKKDLAGFSQTGSGKTGIFLITIAERLLSSNITKNNSGPKAFILAPTRELAIQINNDLSKIFKQLKISSISVFGGMDYKKQGDLLKKGVDVVVATPGRVKDFYRKGLLKLNQCQIFVCDEVDRMFEMGFIEDVEFFLRKIPEASQKLFFSATTNPKVKELAFKYLDDPEYITSDPEIITPEAIEQSAVICEAQNKLRVLMGFLIDHNPDCALIFTNTKIAAEWLHFKLTHNGMNVDIITGDLPQRKRISLIEKIKKGQIKALIATDVASRGLHIENLTHIYNFDLPDQAENYIHRIGRTARAGKKGYAFSFVCEDYGHNLDAINRLLGDNFALHARWYDKKYLKIKDKAGNPFKPTQYNTSRHQKPKQSTPKSPSKEIPQTPPSPKTFGGIIKQLIKIFFKKIDR